MIPPERNPIDARGFVVTRAGIAIGIAHQRRRPLHTFTRSEEQLQRALLAKPKCIDWSTRIETAVLVAGFSAGLLGSIFLGA